jgi:hypothetical protein
METLQQIFYLPNFRMLLNRISMCKVYQHNTTDKLWAANMRFDWLQKANTGLFLVWDYNLQYGDPLNNSFIVKYTRIFDLVK